MNQTRESCRLAWKDWKHECLLSLCAVLALASMLAPILVLTGLKNGLLEGMRQKLMRDPAVLIITPKSDAGKFPPAFISELASLPGARFAIGKTRETSTDISLTNPENGMRASIAFEPSAPGEPVLENVGLKSPEDGKEPQIILSATAAKALGASAGSALVASIGRRAPGGKLESFRLTLHVAGILPPETADRKMAFAPLALMEDLENYRDYIAVPGRGLEGRDAAAERQYASFRLYAAGLDDVESLAAWLEGKKIEVITRAREIATIRSLETAINNVILIISLAVGAGFTAFTISSAESAVRRKNRMLGLLRLLGFRRLSLLLFPLAQSFLTAVGGFLLSLLLYLCASMAIGGIFNAQGLDSCSLSFGDIALAASCVLVLSLLASLRAATSAAGVEPSTVIREI